MNVKPSCETCPKQYTKKCPIDFSNSNGNSDIYDGVRRVTGKCLMGCHPQAREYLMEPVLKELERRLHTPTDHRCACWVVAVYEEVITLIKNGVGGK